MKKPEILSPAGSYEGFLGAVNAGADAVYMAGESYGARAYAKNFTQNEYLRALDYAHLHDRKIYMTVNTVIKNREYDALFDYMHPYYEEGLDGVIVQEPSLIKFFRTNFPDMEIHASTQMCVSSYEGALFMQELGVDRVVPARELSLNEVKEIVSTGIDTECFIHGSMCYCYSGQCLFSSMLGDRSGNRGRCAQPCRLPYSMKDKSSYILSLKDMCTIEMLPELIDAGIASFKIEGRMKNPAYTAGVTSIYRKMTDSYLENPNKEYKVSAEDMEILSNLYIRTSRTTGYYHMNHGKKMITPDSPSYMGNSDKLTNFFIDKYCREPVKKDISVKGKFITGSNALITINDSVTVEGNEVCKAMKAPLTKEDVEKRISKTGDSFFNVSFVSAEVSEDAFLPVGSINELRRNAVSEYENELLAKFCRKCPEEQASLKMGDNFNIYKDDTVDKFAKEDKTSDLKKGIMAFVNSESQIRTVLKFNRKLISGIVIPSDILSPKEFIKYAEEIHSRDISVFMRSPMVFRSQSEKDLYSFTEKVKDTVEGVFVNQMDTIYYFKEQFPNLLLYGDINLYVCNDNEGDFFKNWLKKFTVSPELNKDEINHLDISDGLQILYGRIPLMNTANCVCLSSDMCKKETAESNGFVYIKDRVKANLPVRLHCSEKMCYNTIYNSVPVSLHKQIPILMKLNCSDLCMHFTDESEDDILRILDMFDKLINEDVKDVQPFYEYTNGHFKNGVL